MPSPTSLSAPAAQTPAARKGRRRAVAALIILSALGIFWLDMAVLQFAISFTPGADLARTLLSGIACLGYAAWVFFELIALAQRRRKALRDLFTLIDIGAATGVYALVVSGVWVVLPSILLCVALSILVGMNGGYYDVPAGAKRADARE